MDRRGFLRFLGMGVAAAAAPTVAYSFLGGILRPRKATDAELLAWMHKQRMQAMERIINPPLVYSEHFKWEFTVARHQVFMIRNITVTTDPMTKCVTFWSPTKDTRFEMG